MTGSSDSGQSTRQIKAMLLIMVPIPVINFVPDKATPCPPRPAGHAPLHDGVRTGIEAIQLSAKSGSDLVGDVFGVA